MREGWEYKKLGEVCKVERGSSPRPIKKYITKNEDGVNWIKIGDVKENAKYVYSTKQKITKEGAEKSRFVDVGDFILSNSMSFGRPYIMKVPGYIHDGWFVLRLPLNIDSNYFWYLLSSPLLMDQFNLLAAGAIVKNISGDLVKKAKLPIPPLPEQKQIVKILDQAFEAIDQAKANIEKNIVNANELFQSKLNEIFSQKGEGWEEKSIQEVSSVVNGYSFKSSDFSVDNEVKAIKITNVGVKEFLEDFTNNLPKSFLEEYSRVKVTEGDIVIALTRTIISNGLKVAKVPKSYNEALLNQRVAAIIPKENIINSNFLYYYFSSDIVYNYVLDNVNMLMQPNLSINDLKKMKVPVTSIEHQNILSKQIENLMDYVNTIVDKYSSKLTSLEELKKSILEKAFSGELTN